MAEKRDAKTTGQLRLVRRSARAREPKADGMIPSTTRHHGWAVEMWKRRPECDRRKSAQRSGPVGAGAADCWRFVAKTDGLGKVFVPLSIAAVTEEALDDEVPAAGGGNLLAGGKVGNWESPLGVALATGRGYAVLRPRVHY